MAPAGHDAACRDRPHRGESTHDGPSSRHHGGSTRQSRGRAEPLPTGHAKALARCSARAVASFCTPRSLARGARDIDVRPGHRAIADAVGRANRAKAVGEVVAHSTLSSQNGGASAVSRSDVDRPEVTLGRVLPSSTTICSKRQSSSFRRRVIVVDNWSVVLGIKGGAEDRSCTNHDAKRAARN